MPKNEGGEYEVVLGNKQLLSIFFVVVILLGVFFTMGYVLGRGSASPAERLAETRKSSPPLPVTAARPAPEKQPSAFGYAPPPPEPAAPVQSPPQAEPEPQEPAPGSVYLQVAAVKRPEADVVADLLKKKGFRSFVAPHPNEPVFRVLVGPLADADAVAKTRADLVAAGFKPLLRKF